MDGKNMKSIEAGKGVAEDRVAMTTQISVAESEKSVDNNNFETEDGSGIILFATALQSTYPVILMIPPHL